VTSESVDSMRILIAEDSATDRLILETIVAKAGHIPIGVSDGIEALESYRQESPDLVLLDVLMPNMGGIDVARNIRNISCEDVVPIIFLTSLSDQESLVECLECGGDDFIPKPYNQVVLQSKIKAFGRLRRMHSTVTQQKAQIEAHNRHLIQEQTVAKQVFDKIAHTGCLDMGSIRHYMSPLAVFNGDVLVSEISPNGNMVVMLGDFTGHGLPAAIGSMPLASTFYGMVRKGFNMPEILREINQKLNDILPIGFFCCAICVDINFKERVVNVWNGGLPEAFLYRCNTNSYELLPSKNLPLGVLPSSSFNPECESFQLECGDRLYMWSDGAFEARDQDGEMFGEHRLHSILYDNPGDSELFNKILTSVQAHIGSSEKDDDVSLVEIEMQDIDVVAEVDHDNQNKPGRLSDWYMNFNLLESSLKEFDPLPLLMNIISEVPGLRQHRTPLYTVLAELYTNALEHGLLRLSSELKCSVDGFATYYEERKKRLENLSDGSVSFSLSHKGDAKGGWLKIRVMDSGPGFEINEKCAGNKDENFFGRGLTLIRQLSESLTIHQPGNDIEVVYRWNHDE